MPLNTPFSTALTGLAAITLSLAVSAAAFAQPAATPEASSPDVTVRIGPALAAKAHKLGQTEVNDIAKDLDQTVRNALRGGHRANTPVRVDLVLEDATPNRPTIQQLGDNPSLSERSIALGGAAISGLLTFADGHTEPLSYSFHEISLQYDIGAVQWTDADRTFDMLADALAHGHVPHDRLDIRVADTSFDQWPR